MPSVLEESEDKKEKIPLINTITIITITIIIITITVITLRYSLPRPV